MQFGSLTAAFALIVSGLAVAPAKAVGPPAWATPSEGEIRAILADRIDRQHAGVGLVVGVIDAHGRHVVGYGALNQGDDRPLTGKTVFEIGSATKVFTSLVLADMAVHHRLRLDDPVESYLPAGTHLPERGGRKIELIDLSTHTSGLPRLPTNLDPTSDNPYAAYGMADFYRFLGGYTLPRDIGGTYEYSNAGAGLLGIALARKAGSGYEAMIEKTVSRPLGMIDTVVTLSADQQRRLAVGHDDALKPVGNWDLPTLAGAGALRSTVDDLLTFLSAELGYTKTPLQSAMAAQIVPRRQTGTPGIEIALGWHVFLDPQGGDVVWHDGGTGGYRSFIGFDAKTGVGVVVLANVADRIGVVDIGRHILSGTPLIGAKHVAIALPGSAMARYVGRYALTPDVIVTISRAGDQLSAQLTGQGANEIFAESATDFFYKVVDAQISFSVAADGSVDALTLYQGGRATLAKRLP